MANPYEYIFFEADQVLTNNDLNETFSYLDQQNRWTRNKLIGIGIVCGFDIVHHTGVIEITKGCGVTSQGYLITQGDALYTYYMPYSVPAQPTNPLFSYPDNNLPFYQPFYSNKIIYVLLTDDEQAVLDADQQKNALPLSNANFLNDYTVVLFLEATETNLKNCDMFDCNNNGEKISFNIKPLLVAKKDLPVVTNAINNGAAGTITNLPHEIYFKRFNVPYANLQTANDVINAFAKLVDDFTLTRIANAYTYAYEKYQFILNETVNPFTGLLKQLQTQRDSILKTNGVFIQYFYDFADDLIKAYYEFAVKASSIVSSCCPDENLFPLHLVLGEASKDTDVYAVNAYRQNFIYSPLFDKDYAGASEAVFLFERMKLLTKEFTVLSQQTFANSLVKITPSQYEHEWLSQRCIPYYYNINESQNELYKSWSYYKTTHGNAAYNLSYNAYKYNSNDAVINPLLYDIEYNNFFRVEGHIGKDYSAVLNDLVSQIQTYNLPFDVVAIQAGGDDTTIADDEPQCSFQDLNSMFNVLKSDLYCLLGKLMCYAASQTYNPPIIITHFPPIFENVDVNANLANEAKITAAGKATFEAASAASLSVAANKASSTNLLLTNTFFNFFLYQKSTFLKQEGCFNNLADNSVGKYYAQHVPSGTYFFSSFDAANLSNNFLTIVDLIEEVVSTLYFASLSSINTNNFSEKISTLQNYLLQLNNVFLQFEGDQKKENLFADFEENMDLFDEVIDNCFTDKFSSLKNEYNARIKLIKQQVLFSNYYNQHRGMEHKAGVPKGGTFVIVYNAPAPKQTSNTATTSNDTNTAAFNNLSNMSAQAKFSASELTQRLHASFSDVIEKDPEFINRAISILSPTFTAVALPPAIPDNVIIADFYLPYLCCSNCAPVTYVLPPKDDVIFDIQPNKFLFDDAHNYPFTAAPGISPTDFNSTSNPGNLNLLMEDNTLKLHPAMDIKTTLKDTALTYKSKTIFITIVVPDASFTVNVTTDVTGAPLVALAAKNTDATTYQWLVNDKENIFENKANPAPVALNTLEQETGSNEFRIEFIITYVINDNTSSDDKKAILKVDDILKNLNKGAFEPTYVDDFIKASTATSSDANVTDSIAEKPVSIIKDEAVKKPVIAVKDSSTKKNDDASKSSTIKKPDATSKKRNKKS
jgi:hypothetical protein